MTSSKCFKKQIVNRECPVKMAKKHKLEISFTKAFFPQKRLVERIFVGKSKLKAIKREFFTLKKDARWKLRSKKMNKECWEW